GAPQGWKILCHRREFLVSGQFAHPQADHRGSEKSEHTLSGRADDRRLDRRTCTGSRAQGRRLADRRREDPRGNGEREGRYAGTARRGDRVEQGQPLPNASVLPRLSLGSRKIGGRRDKGLGRLRREVMRGAGTSRRWLASVAAEPGEKDHT